MQKLGEKVVEWKMEEKPTTVLAADGGNRGIKEEKDRRREVEMFVMGGCLVGWRKRLDSLSHPSIDWWVDVCLALLTGHRRHADQARKSELQQKFITFYGSPLVVT